MQQNFNPFLKFFFLTGLLHKNCDSEKTFLEKLSAFCWSFVMFSFHFVTLLFIIWAFMIELTVRNYLESSFNLLLFFSVFTTLFSTAVLKRFDKQFWVLVNECQNIFAHHIGMQTNDRTFMIRCWLKIAFGLTVLLLCQFYHLLPPLIVFRLFFMKFDFYVDALHFCLKNIEVKLSSSRISKHDMKCLKNAYTLCWKMNQIIEKAFGLGMLFAVFYTIAISIYAGKRTFVGYIKGKINWTPIIYAFMSILGMMTTGLTCQSCINCSLSIAPKVFKKSSNEYHKLIESFGLQLLHQRITFMPLKAFYINHKSLLTVSGIIKIDNFFYNFNSLRRRSHLLFSTM